MDDLIKLRQQIVEMEKQASELQKKNRSGVLAQLREQMAAYGITAEELSRPAPRAPKPKAAPAKPAASAPKGKKPAVALPAKYRGPQGQEWSGRGPTPKWLKDLQAESKIGGDFQISPDASVSGSAAAQ